MKKYNFHELRSLARDQKIKRWGYMNKDQLCKVLNVVRVEHLPKYSLENVASGEISKWRSTIVISKAFDTNTGNIVYALKNGKPLKTQKGSFYIQKDGFRGMGIESFRHIYDQNWQRFTQIST